MSVNLTLETLASKQRNDSTVAGVTVKDALETLEGLTSGSGIVLHFYGDPIAAGTTGGRIYLNGDSLELLPFVDNLVYLGKRGYFKGLNTDDAEEFISDGLGGDFFNYGNNPTTLLSSIFFADNVFNLVVDPGGIYGSIQFVPIKLAPGHWCFEVTANTLTKNSEFEFFIFVDAILNPATGQISTPASGGGGFADGDYGDIVVSGSGTALTIDANAVTNSKLAPNAVDVTKIANSTITQAKLNATGATNGRVLMTDGTDFSWQDLPTPPSGGLDDGTYGDIVVSGGGTVLTIGADAVTTSKIQDGAVTFPKMQSISSGKILGRQSAGVGTIEELDAISTNNLPIGAIINRWGGTSLADPTNMNELVENMSNYLPNTLNWNFISNGNFSTKLSNNIVSTSRVAFLQNSSNYTIYIQGGNVFQTSSDGSLFSNIEDVNLKQSIGSNTFTWHSNNVNNKLVYLNTNYSYVYSEDGTTFTLVKSPIVSGSHIELTRPVISGSTYSFWDNTNSKRIYTTDHINFSDVTGFGTSDLQVQRMSNGHLYTTNGTTLRISTNDGQTWTSYTLPVATANSGFHCVDFNDTKYVYCTTSNRVYVASVPDLISGSWFLVNTNIPGTNTNHRVWYVNGTFFVFSATSATTSFSTSTDGITWTNRTSPNAIICNAVIYVNSVYMILGTNRVITSSDLVTWISSIAFGNTDADAMHRTFFGTGTKALMLASNTAYFYNAGSWTTVTSSQQNANIVGVLTTSGTGQFIKAK